MSLSSGRIGAIKVIENDARTSWSFSADAADTLTCSAAAYLDVRARERGRGVFALRDIGPVSPIFSETPTLAVISGKHRDRVCSHCLRMGLTKAVRHEECSDLTFCDRTCMDSHSTFIDMCGTLLDRVKSDKYMDTFRMLITFLFYRNDSNKFIASKLYQSIIDGNELHLDQKLDPHLENICLSWFKLIRDSKCSSLLRPNDTPQLINRFVRAVKFNAQSLPIPQLPSTSILCVFDCMSKLNHSCSPNAQILYNNADGVLTARVVATRPIAAGEEICISYINAIGQPVDARRLLLQEAFHFRCACQRCLNEENQIKGAFFFETVSDATKLEELLRSSLDSKSRPIEDDLGLFLSVIDRGILREVNFADLDSSSRRYYVDMTRIHDFATTAFLHMKTRVSVASTTEGSISILILKYNLIRICHLISSILSFIGSEYSNDRLMITIHGVGVASKFRRSDIKDPSVIDSINYIVTEAYRILQFHLLAVDESNARASIQGTVGGVFKQFCSTVKAVRSAFHQV